MSIRPTTRSDIPAIVDILTKAFWDEDAVGRFMHPHREQYPDGVKKFWRRSLRSIWWEGSHSLLVAVNDHGIIVGYANWKLSGGEQNRKGVTQKLLQVYARAHNSISTKLSPDCAAADPMTMTSMIRAVPFFTDKLPTPRYDLQTLAVHPSYQGHGYGRLLVQWGIEGATRERLPAAVIVAEGTEEFYLKCGFEREVGNVTEGEGNPLAGVKGGSILVKDSIEEAGNSRSE